MNFEILVFLIFGHFIGDFALQSEWLSKNKHLSFYFMFAHGMIYTGVLSIIMWQFGIFAIWKVGFILIGHCVCDWIRKDKYLYPDQLWHFTQILVIWIV